MRRFFLWYVKGVSIVVVFLILLLILGENPMINSSNSKFVNWFYTFLIFLSPIGAIAGYLLWMIIKFLLSMVGITTDKQPKSEPKQPTPCLFAGTIYVERDTTILGFHWPSSSAAFEIGDDWKVLLSNGTIFGWIDQNGVIYEDRTVQNVDPSLTLGRKMFGKIVADKLWIKEEVVGYLNRKLKIIKDG